MGCACRPCHLSRDEFLSCLCISWEGGVPRALGRDIIFGTAEHVPSRTAKQLAKSLMKIVKLYALGGFVVCTVLMDGVFEEIKPEVELMLISLLLENTWARLNATTVPWKRGVDMS